MDTNVPYMPSVVNLPKILDAIQKAAVPDSFNVDFLKDLGFTSSYDRSILKTLRYLGFIDASNRPQSPYRDFVDHNKARFVLAERLRAAFDDLFVAHPQAQTKGADELKGWFKSKTGVSDSVATKLASNFKALADYADFKGQPSKSESPKPGDKSLDPPPLPNPPTPGEGRSLGLVYRLEIHLPDTQNIETFRAIFKALREELNP